MIEVLQKKYLPRYYLMLI